MMHGEGEDSRVVGEDRGGAVSVVYVEVDDGDPLDDAFGH